MRCCGWSSSAIVTSMGRTGFITSEYWTGYAGLLTSGMGSIAPRGRCTRALIEAANPQLLVSVGIAGAVNADLQIGMWLIPRIPVFWKKVGWQVRSSRRPLFPDGLAGNSSFVSQAGQAMVYRGPPITTQVRNSCHKSRKFPNPVLEMETAASAGQ